MMDLDLVHLIKSVGYAGLFTTVFLENGALIFLFLPGDTLLFTAGILASQGILDIRILIGCFFAASVLGYMFGYSIGHKSGLAVFRMGDTRYLKRVHLEKAQNFYRKYGNWALVTGRFVPLRSFVSFLAGAATMPYPAFMLYNILGAVVWAGGLPLLGFYFGKLIPSAHSGFLYLIPIISVIIIIVGLPAILYFRRKRESGDTTKKGPTP
ncbi:MAG: DedA family protein [Alphaproteobacteria bacterium]|nr:DedA family protein [Alphaproteobacteria bacterium]